MTTRKTERTAAEMETVVADFQARVAAIRAARPVDAAPVVDATRCPRCNVADGEKHLPWHGCFLPDAAAPIFRAMGSR